MTKMMRKDYKAIQHMKREEMQEYLSRLYNRGYNDGMRAQKKIDDEGPSKSGGETDAKV